MKSILASSILLSFVMLFIFGAIIFNINLTAGMISKQNLMQEKLASLEEDSKLTAINLGDLIDVAIEEIQTEDNGQVPSNERSSYPTMMSETPNVSVELNTDEITAIFSKAPNLQLDGANGSFALGKAATAVYDGDTYHKIAAINMPSLPAGSFYQGWLINEKTGDMISSGVMNYEASTSNATLFYLAKGDKSDYRKVIVTKDTNIDTTYQNSAKILEGTFADDVDFSVALDLGLKKVESGKTEAKQPQSDLNNMSMDELVNSLKSGGNASSLLEGGNIDSLNIADLLTGLNMPKK